MLTFTYLVRIQLGNGTLAWTGSATGTLEPILLTSVEASPAILPLRIGIWYRENLIYLFPVTTRARLSLHIFVFGLWSYHSYFELRHSSKGLLYILPGVRSPPDHECDYATLGYDSG